MSGGEGRCVGIEQLVEFEQHHIDAANFIRKLERHPA